MTNQKIKVLYIAGSGRSGTTIMARLLGEIDGFVNVGEAARYLLDSNLQARNTPCGCGKPVGECEFWKDIIQAVPPSLASLGTELVRMRRFPSLMRAQQSGVAGYGAILTAVSSVYEKVVQDTGCKVIVDSSKNPANGLLVSLIPDVELHVLHVVRNPHQVVASWTKKKGYLAAHRPGPVIAWWWSYNILSEALQAKARSYRRVRYEDFVRDPGGMLQQIARNVVGAPVATPFLNANEASVHVQHVLAGNPDKLNVGRVKIGDRSNAATGSRKLLINLLTFPLQLRYQYMLSRSPE
jgi:hypothetical protein